ncbi:MAG TPA: hypothetical protein VFF30_03830 [Nitrososphaerales archaeon]|nr:hypothetical protein [Nitrososphaerales archaeon]
MRIPSYAAHYLTSNGLFLTPNSNSISGSAARLPQPLQGNTLLDPVELTRKCRELAINITVQAVSGSGGLTVYFYALDPIEPSNNDPLWGLSQNPNNPPMLKLQLNSSAINAAPTTMRFIISGGQAVVWVNGTGANIGIIGPIPRKWQLGLAISGSFGSGQGFSVLGSWEGKE